MSGNNNLSARERQQLLEMAKPQKLKQGVKHFLAFGYVILAIPLFLYTQGMWTYDKDSMDTILASVCFVAGTIMPFVVYLFL